MLPKIFVTLSTLLAILIENVSFANGIIDWNLYDSALRGNLAQVREALAQGADVNVHYAYTPLRGAAGKGYSAIVDELIKAGADVNDVDELGLTALMSAADQGELEVVKQLIDAGANVSFVNEKGESATRFVQETLQANAHLN